MKLCTFRIYIADFMFPLTEHARRAQFAVYIVKISPCYASAKNLSTTNPEYYLLEERALK